MAQTPMSAQTCRASACHSKYPTSLGTKETGPTKCAKHCVTREEIEAVFRGTPAVMPDPFPDEPRMRAIGKPGAGRYLFIVFMLRAIDGMTLIRPVKARYLHQQEIDGYERA